MGKQFFGGRLDVAGVEQRPVTVKNGGDRKLSPEIGDWFNWGHNATQEEKEDLAGALVKEVYGKEPPQNAVNTVLANIVEHLPTPGWETTEEEIRTFAGEG